MEKKELRRYIRELKKKYTPEEKQALSLPVWEKMEQLEHFRKAATLLLYWSMEDEVVTPDFIRKWYRDKRILLPCVKGDVLELRVFEGEASLQPGESFGILEPTGELFTDYDAIDLVVVPGVAFDREGGRLGRGRGYYDKILAQVPEAVKVGICFPFQQVECVPCDPWDVAMNEVVCGE